MPTHEEISPLQDRLGIHRRNVSTLLEQKAKHSINVPLNILEQIRDQQLEIGKIKNSLRGWGIAVEDLPDDGESSFLSIPNIASIAPKRIFVSYKRDVLPDEPLVKQITMALQGQHTIFLDRNMPVGTVWAQRIEQEIKQADFMIVFISEHAINSEMLRAETELAYKLYRNTGRPTIIPVRLNFVSPFQYPLSKFLNDFNWAVWNDEHDTPRLIDELGSALRGEPFKPFQDLPLPHLELPTLTMPTPEAQLSTTKLARLNLEAPEGTMDTDSKLYMEREGDDVALNAIRRTTGVTITIKGPRQMGKSSLLIRIIHTAATVQKRVAFLDFQLFDQAALQNPTVFFRQFCASITDALDVPDKVDEFWQSSLGNPQKCTRYVERYLLKQLDSPLVLAMDEVETVFDTDFRSDFFGMLRSWHNNRALHPIWKKLDLALVTSTEPYQLIANLNQSPFNVGEVITLDDFSLAEVEDLNKRHDEPFQKNELHHLMQLLHGQPYLIRKALYLVANGRISIETFFATATDERGPFGDHLRYHLFRLHNKPDLIQAMLQVLHTQQCPDEHLFFRLRGAGLVRRERSTSVVPRCDLYASYFKEHLHAR